MFQYVKSDNCIMDLPSGILNLSLLLVVCVVGTGRDWKESEVSSDQCVLYVCVIMIIMLIIMTIFILNLSLPLVVCVVGTGRDW